MTSKVVLRKHYRQQRMWIKMEDRQRWSGQIAERVLELPQLRSAAIVFSYLSNWGEVATNLILDKCLVDGRTVLTPSPDHTLLPEHGFHRAVSVSETRSIVTEPCREAVSISDIDVILVPGIVWDISGHRIGFGGGYFDRLLSEKRTDAVAIGLSYDLQVVDAVPNDSWDKAVDLVVTQSRVYGALDGKTR